MSRQSKLGSSKRWAIVLALLMIGSVASLSSVGASFTPADNEDLGTGSVSASDLLAAETETTEDIAPVQARDLASSLDRLTEAQQGFQDEDHQSQVEELEPLDPELEVALASIVEATAISIEARETLLMSTGALGSGTHASPSQADTDTLLTSSAQLLATIEAHMPTLQEAAADGAGLGPDASPESSEPDVLIPNLLAIDLGGDTTYEFNFVLKIDLAGDDTHLDPAGAATGGCFIPCPETSISIDVNGEDAYERTLDADGGSIMAAQGSARGYGAVGILVDGQGNDDYHVDGDLDGDEPADLSRLSQGSAAALGVGVLADLGGEDSYTTAWTDIPDRYNRPQCGYSPCDYWIAAQGSVFQERGTVDPGWGLLLDHAGDDTYEAQTRDFPAQGVMELFAGDFDTASEQGLAGLLDLGGNDVYEGNTLPTMNHYERQEIEPSGSGHFLDTDASNPSAQVLEPENQATLVGDTDVTVKARDLGDAFGLDARQVETVTVSIGMVETTASWQDGSDEQTLTVDVSPLDPGTYDLVAEVTNEGGNSAQDTVTVTVEDA